jgi:hypothetical protein
LTHLRKKLDENIQQQTAYTHNHTHATVGTHQATLATHKSYTNTKLKSAYVNRWLIENRPISPILKTSP